MSLALKMSLTYKRACLIVFANKLATLLKAVKGLSSSFIIGLSPEANT
jgi:hypothetical protein